MIKYSLLLGFLLFILLPLFSHAQNFGGHPASIQWQQFNGKEVRVIFPAGLDSQANRVYQLASLLDSTTLYTIGNKIRKWNIVLLNQTTESNAYVRMAPVMSELYMNPEQNNFSTGSLRWDDNLIIHENRHMQQFSNFNKGFTKVFSFLLGQEGQLLANGIAVPDYFFEGDAVWQETWVSQQGRGRMPSFYNGLKSLWLADKKYSWMQMRNGSLRHYLPDHYELGYPLVAYGYEKYGDGFWRKVTEDAVRFRGLFYSFNHAIERYSGKSYQQFREDALLYYKEKILPVLHTDDEGEYLTAISKNNVVDYLFPAYVNGDTIIVAKKSYRELSSFYFIINGKEKKIRVTDFVTDNYFSYRNGKLVYAAFRSDPRRGNRDYSDIRVLDIYSNQQRKLTNKATYFSPDINESGTEIIAVKVNRDGSNFLQRLDSHTGKIIQQLPNPSNYFFTQTKYINKNEAVSAVRHPDGRMALLKINFSNGNTEILSPLTYHVLGYPFVKNDTVYYTMMDIPLHKNLKSGPISDKIFAVDLHSKKNYQITENVNGVYQPVVNNRGEMLVSVFTADGYRLQKIDNNKKLWTLVSPNDKDPIVSISNMATTHQGMLDLASLNDATLSAKGYKKSFQLFNFHSARPYASDPEYGYSFYGDNVLSSFSNVISYRYNRNERSSSFGYDAAFAGLFPVLTAGVAYTYNRNIDTAMGQGIRFNSAKASAGFYIPLHFIGGKTFKYLNVGGGFNIEQIAYIGIGKNVFANKALQYANSFVSFSNVSRQAKQHIHPRWAQAVSLNYLQEFTYYQTKKLLGNASLFFPGLFKNHSLYFNASYQTRDTLPDLFSNNFSYSRGYEALNTRRMYKLGINYQFPLLYPDAGFGNILFFQRISANVFFDYTSAKARQNYVLREIINRSMGAEIYFDTKIWNALPVNLGVRYSYLLDTDLRNPAVKNRWEIILPINLVPN
jgi:hypothetical protein